jgi:ribosomal protein S18 acetylase RimI-like enzyme
MPNAIPTGSKLTLRTATDDDEAIVARLMTGLNDAVGPDGILDSSPEDVLVSPEQARSRMRAMAPAEEVVLAFVDEEPAGLFSLRIVPYLSQDVPHAEVTELYVVPEWRRQGVATMLMAQAEFLARERGATAVHVLAWHENEAAQAFYRALGYRGLEIGFNKYLPRRSSSRKRRAEG